MHRRERQEKLRLALITSPPDCKRVKKRFVATEQIRKSVRLLSQTGVPQEIAILILDVSEKVFRAHLLDDWRLGRRRADLGVKVALFRKALSGDTQALIWWTKAQMGWRSAETQVTVNNNVNVGNATAQELINDLRRMCELKKDGLSIEEIEKLLAAELSPADESDR